MVPWSASVLCICLQVAACCAVRHSSSATGLLALLIFVGFLGVALVYVVVLVTMYSQVGGLWPACWA
jgi:hypothetical protein